MASIPNLPLLFSPLPSSSPLPCLPLLGLLHHLQVSLPLPKFYGTCLKKVFKVEREVRAPRHPPPLPWMIKWSCLFRRQLATAKRQSRFLECYLFGLLLALHRLQSQWHHHLRAQHCTFPQCHDAALPMLQFSHHFFPLANPQHNRRALLVGEPGESH